MQTALSTRDSELALARFGPGDSLSDGLLTLLRQSDFPAAVVASAIGSLDEVRYAHAQVDEAGIPRYSACYTRTGPLEIASLQGHLGRGGEGEPQLHLHGVFVASDGQLAAGHVLDGTVLVTVEVGLLSAKDVCWHRSVAATGPSSGLPILLPMALHSPNSTNVR